MLKSDIIKRIYNEWKNKELDLDKMISAYGINTDRYIYWECEITFKRGRDYFENGIILMSDYEKIKKKLDDGGTINLGEINGKHSDGTANKYDITFHNDKEKIENYIYSNGYRTSEEYFYDLFQSDEDNVDVDVVEDSK